LSKYDLTITTILSFAKVFQLKKENTSLQAF